MTPDQLSGELTARLDGPHGDGSTAGAARLAAETVRFLNYATGSHAGSGLTEPATVYMIAANLSAAAYGLPQLFRQLSGWLEAERVAGRLADDTDRLPVAAMTAREQLKAASQFAAGLGRTLNDLQLAVSGLHRAGGDTR